MFNSIYNVIGQDPDGSAFAEVGIDTAIVPYAAIHQFGGTIEHPGSDKFQAFEIGGQWVYTHGTKPHPITIPARPYMMFQDADVEQIIQILGDKIVSSIKFVDASGNSSASSVVA